MVRKLTKERKKEVTAVVILLLWVIAWVVSLNLNKEIPQALNVVMPMASAILLGLELPTGSKEKGTK